MSYIQCIVTSRQVYMASDGREMIADKIVSEKFKKIRRFNNNVLVGFAGHKNFCELVLNLVQQNCSICKDVETIFENINNFSKEIISKNGMLNGQFIVAGQFSDSELGFKTLSTNNGYSTITNKPKCDTDILFSEAFSDKVGGGVLEMELKTILKEKNGCISYDDLEIGMKYAAQKASEIDRSVNQEFYLEKIII